MAGQTISTASGKLYLTSTSNPLTITSTGSVTTTASGDAISAPSGTAWQINNAGTISGVIGTSSAGIYSAASGIAVQNTGKISGYVAGLWLSSGGTVTNGASGLISATGSYGVYIAGAAGVVTNLGTITGSSYAVDLTFSSAANRVVVAPGAVFNGLVSGGNGVLELAGSGAAGTLSGTIGGTSGSFENFSQLVVNSGAVWALSGALKITTVQLGGSLEVASDTTPSTQINFASGGKLTIDNTASFSGSVLSNFAAGDIVDIRNFTAAGAAISYNSSTGVAQISNGSKTATLDFNASTLGAGALQVASDGGTGVVLTLSQTTAPAAPTIASPANGSIDTTTTEPVISGTGVAGDVVSLSIDGGAPVTATVQAGGGWSYALTSPLGNGSHTLSATQAAAGGPSSAPSAADTFTVNVPTAPAAPTIASPANGSIDTTTTEPVISGTGVAGDVVSLSIDGGAPVTATVQAGGGWSYALTSPLGNGSHTLSATQAAAGGPSSAPSAADTFTVNVPTAPAAPTIASPANGSIDTTTTEPVISGTGVAGDVVSLSIDGGAPVTATVQAGGGWSYALTSPLGNGSHTLSATQTAAGGPSSAPSAADTFTVNVPTAPAAPTIASPANGSIDTTTTEPVISGTGVAGDVVSLSIDGGAPVTATVQAGGGWSYALTSPLGNGSHTLSATQAAAGGPSSAPSAADTFTVNVPTAPAAPTIASPANGSIDTTTTEPVISGTGVAGDVVSLSIDGGAPVTATVQAGGGWSYALTSPLGNGSHTLSATQAAAGGPSSAPSAADTFTVNVPTAPAAPTIASPANGSIDTTTTEPVISGTGVAGDVVSLSIDGGAPVTATVQAGGGWSYALTSPLGNGSHTLSATQAAAGGPSSAPSAADTFTVNVSGSGLTISSAVTGPLSLAATNTPLTITSAGSVKATASGADAIDGGSGVAWSIDNSGTVASSQRYGVSLHGAGSSIVNSGSISGNAGESFYGVDMEAGGTVTNTSAGYITGGEDAIFGAGAALNVNNSGQIVSTFDDGVGLFNGGSVINNAGAVIQAPTGGGFGPAGVYIPSGSANVVNHGSITGQYGVYLGVAGTVENAGTISGSSSAVTFAVSSSANRLIVDPGAVFNGSVKGNGGVLELTAGTGSIGSIGSSSFSGFQTLTDDASGLWTLTGSNTIANVTDNGSLFIAGSLDVSTAVGAASSGQFDLQTGSSLEVASDAATHSQVDFLGSSQLTIDNAALFGTGVGGSSYAGPLLEDFGAGDTVDLHSFAAAASLLYNPANGLLQVTNGSSQVATLDFQNSTLGSGSFSVASDGSGGIKIAHS